MTSETYDKSLSGAPSPREEIQQIAQESDAQRASECALMNDPWGGPFGLEDAFQDRPPRQCLFGDLFGASELSFITGDAGTGKTNLKIDAACAFLSGGPWLAPHPGGQGPAFKKGPIDGAVAIVNYDSPSRLLHTNVAAFARAYGLGPDARLHYWNFPQPHLTLAQRGHVAALAKRLESLGVVWCIIDAFVHVRGDADENAASELAPALAGARYVAESGPHVTIIHHNNKGGIYRGSTAIPAAADFMFSVAREDSDLIITPTKCRHAEVKPFGATFSYTHKPGTRELETARFYGFNTEVASPAAQVERAILEIVREQPGRNQSQITSAMPDTVNTGKNEVHRQLDLLANKGLLRLKMGAHGAKCFSITESGKARLQ